jgi:predicted RNA-binding Zn-ribbon protein involved in translation (DUF1610 family)
MQPINKKIGELYVRIGAGLEVLLFNRNVLGQCFCLFVELSMATITGKPPRIFMRPACPTCGSRMSLVRIFPDRPGQDQHTYECPWCGDEITEIVQSMKADAFY